MPPQPLTVLFFKTESGVEPVRDWLKALPAFDKKAIGTDIRTVQIGWPMGMPLVRKMDADLWEIRSDILSGIARVLFTIDGHDIVLLHGFVKKSKTTPKSDLDLAKRRLRQFQRFQHEQR